MKAVNTHTSNMTYIREYIHNQIRAPAQYTTISKVHDKKYTKSHGPATATIRTTATHPSPKPANAKMADLHIVENTSVIIRITESEYNY